MQRDSEEHTMTVELLHPHTHAGVLHLPGSRIVLPEDSARARLIEALGPTPVGIDELIRDTRLSARAVHVMLLELELAGRLERHSGQRVSLTG